jgi:hypothetical protein
VPWDFDVPAVWHIGHLVHRVCRAFVAPDVCLFGRFINNICFAINFDIYFNFNENDAWSV